MLRRLPAHLVNYYRLEIAKRLSRNAAHVKGRRGAPTAPLAINEDITVIGATPGGLLSTRTTAGCVQSANYETDANRVNGADRSSRDGGENEGENVNDDVDGGDGKDDKSSDDEVKYCLSGRTSFGKRGDRNDVVDEDGRRRASTRRQTEASSRRRYPRSPHPTSGRRRLTVLSRLSTEARCALNETRREMGLPVSDADNSSQASGVTGDLRLPAVASSRVSDARAQSTTAAAAAASDDVSGQSAPRHEKPRRDTSSPRHNQPQRYTSSPRASCDASTDTNEHRVTSTTLPPAATSPKQPAVYFKYAARATRMTSSSASPMTQNGHSDGASYRRDDAEDTSRANRTKLKRLSLRQGVPVVNAATTTTTTTKTREDSFQISAPWYDSRFKRWDDASSDHLSTLPECIREEAIKKCSEWLNKYMI